MSVTILTRLRDIKVFSNIQELGKQTIEKIAQATGLHQSSVYRSISAQEKRNKYPESEIWETKVGQEFLQRLVSATVYEFGIKGNQGAERINSYFQHLRIHEHVGVSASSLRTIKREMELEINGYQTEQEEAEREKGGTVKKVVGSGDETWFGEDMYLVLMDLVSGYLIVEEQAVDRTHETWSSKAESRLKKLGLEVKHFVGDRAPALVKLGRETFGCLAGADIFHAQYDLSKWLGRSLHGKLGQACQTYNKAKKKLTTLEKKGVAEEKIAIQKEVVTQSEQQVQAVETDRQAYKNAQQAISMAVHAFCITDNQPQTSQKATQAIQVQLQELQTIAKRQDIEDKDATVGKVKRQLSDLTGIVDLWWKWTSESLTDTDPQLQLWLLHTLLPVVYWHLQIKKTDNSDIRHRYQAAFDNAVLGLKNSAFTHSVSKKDMEKHLLWATWACNYFHRASSPVEGRNGCLAQSYHNGRGLSKRRLAALTAIHNFDTKRWDGSTPAQRLFGHAFPDMFEWLLLRRKPLPLPRAYKSSITLQPLILNALAP